MDERSTITTRLAVPEDALGLTELVRTCYLGTYPEAAVTRPKELARRIASQELVLAVAETSGGKLVAQVALERRHPGLYEHGRAIVQRPFRGLGLLGRLSRPLLEEHAAALGARFVYGRSVTHHPFTQRYNRRAGFTSLGMLLGVWSDSLRVAGLQAPRQDLSAVLVGLRVERQPRTRRLCLDGSDARSCLHLLHELGYSARRARSGRRVRAPLGLRLEEHASAGILKLCFLSQAPAAPRDLQRLPGLETARLLWADVPVEHGEAPWVLARLRRAGFGFAAYLPEGSLEGDVLRLQRYQGPGLSRERIQLLPENERMSRWVFAENRSALLEESVPARSAAGAP